MPNTSVHFPSRLLEELNRLAAERGVSRNAIIVESCRRVVEERTAWPEGFFDEDRLTRDELAELRSGEQAFVEQIRKARKNRKSVPF